LRLNEAGLIDTELLCIDGSNLARGVSALCPRMRSWLLGRPCRRQLRRRTGCDAKGLTTVTWDRLQRKGLARFGHIDLRTKRNGSICRRSAGRCCSFSTGDPGLMDSLWASFQDDEAAQRAGAQCLDEADQVAL
jgi:hypothetical protein